MAKSTTLIAGQVNKLTQNATANPVSRGVNLPTSHQSQIYKRWLGLCHQF